jgi:predicted histone-like DNA-binding protein
MSQKFKKLQNRNDDSTAYGKWFATAVYDQHFIETEELAEFIQTQASVKKSDIKAVLDELGSAMKHFFELGQKVKLDGIGIFKVGFSSIGTVEKDDCGAATITTRRVLFQPESQRIVVGQQTNAQGKIVQKYIIAKTLVKDVIFEETYDTSLQPESSNSGTNTGGGENSGGGNSGGENTGGGGEQIPGSGGNG